MQYTGITSVPDGMAEDSSANKYISDVRVNDIEENC